MPVELLKDSLTTDQIIGQDTAQAIIEGDILVPDIKPDITRIISVDGVIQVAKVEASEGKITVEGNIKFKILYVAEKGEEPLYSIDSSTGFKQSIEIEGITSSASPDVEADIEHIDFTINNERKIGVKVVINLMAIGKSTSQKEITKDITGLEDIQVLKDTIHYTEVMGDYFSEALVKDTYEVEESMPSIKEILKWNATALERETKITEGKVIVGGIVKVELLYIADDEEASLNIFSQEIPFTHFVEMPDAHPEMKYKLKLDVTELYTEVKENIQGESKILEIEAITRVGAKVMDTSRREIVIDAFSPSKKIKVSKETIEFKENIGMNRSHLMLRETIDLPGSHPEMAKLFSVVSKPVLTDYQLMEDKTVIEGIMEVTVIYLSDEGHQPIYSFMQEIPFRHYVDIEGLQEGMEAKVELFIEEINYELINGQQVDIKVNIGATCEGYLTKKVDIVNEIIEMEESIDLASRPSITIYFMQPGDTLWKVAKKYNTTVKQIIETNNIEDVSTIKPGDYILIEKVHQFKF
ncbi:DUF3794 and LysM peptidoglycan-binding domain-containing protein [Alkaliphilus peptidifermentans]|uniref:LysM repeat-containing protein n=1 Tax=Alkaliphilus peptidifermentans DSM 18978 TaxID=1120976 RepID=A0A1G5KJB1_9FIRM|nr:SPOCS domain-containing protein [Alkaliphilus peptidifermentans]SCZ00148.1 LysM repeat-containing protein [Alkaliphilus peptidifermentans DSM 18978]